jgi:tetratricopeptide (TPR) repeat protein
LEKKEYRQAVHDATEAINHGSSVADSRLTRAGAYAYLGQYDKALADLDALAPIAPNNAMIYERRSAVHAKAGNEAQSLADWERAKKLGSKMPADARLMIPALPEPPRRKKLAPKEARAFAAALRRADTAREQERNDDWEKAADEACRLDPTNAEARSLRARVYGQIGRLEECIKEANEAIRLDPNHAWAYTARGEAKRNLNDPAGAIADCTIAVRLDPTLASAWDNRSRAYHDRKQFHQAMDDSNQALHRRPNNSYFLHNHAACHLFLGEDEKALAEYLKVAAASSDAHLRRICAAIYTRLGKLEDARKQRELAIKLDEKLKDAPGLALPVPPPPVKMDPELANDDSATPQAP